jgi:uncharacterized membrane protein
MLLGGNGNNRMRQQKIFITVAILLILLGVFFRFFALDRKSYWFDETFTSLRISGYTDQETVQRYLATNETVAAGELRKFQSPQSNRTVLDTVRGLAAEEPQNPPLYYIAAKLWADVAGSSIYSMRLLPALFSVLVLPLVYWLCLELFDSPVVGWIAAVLTALSPFYVLQAQTARPQSLWMATTLFTAAALLRAIRTKSQASWIAYAFGAAASLYTFVLSVLSLSGFALYILIREKFKLTRTTVAFAVSSGAALLAFVPWLIALFHSRSNVAATTHWADSKLTMVELFRAWVMGFVRLFFDINSQSGDTTLQLLPILLVLSFLAILIGYSVLVLCRQGPTKASLFILILIGSAFAPLLVVDLLRGGGRMSAAHRYLIPGYLGIQLAVSFLFAQKLFRERNSLRQIWWVQAVLVVVLGVVSCIASSQAESWWNKDPDGINREIARMINRSVTVLVVSDGWLGHLFSLSSYMNDAVKLRIEPRCYVCREGSDQRAFPAIPTEFVDVFYFHPGWEPRAYSNVMALSESGLLQPVISQHGSVVLWKLMKQTQ